MKFVTLESRGGNYMVVASNVAWLRVGENGQTLVGIIGSLQALQAIQVLTGNTASLHGTLLLLDGAVYEPARGQSLPWAWPAAGINPTNVLSLFRFTLCWFGKWSDIDICNFSASG